MVLGDDPDLATISIDGSLKGRLARKCLSPAKIVMKRRVLVCDSRFIPSSLDHNQVRHVGSDCPDNSVVGIADSNIRTLEVEVPA
mgnify:CR=1 FL=1